MSCSGVDSCARSLMSSPEIVRSDAKTDWNLKETVRAKLRPRIKQLLLKG